VGARAELEARGRSGTGDPQEAGRRALIAPLTLAAPAKVNLYLHVTGRRDDGYHLIDSLFVFAAGIADRLTVAPAETLSLSVDGPFADDGLAGDDNLTLRAARALAAAAGTDRGAALTLTKNLPIAAGIGGGSADAAAALRALDRLWGLGWPAERLAGIGAALGADIPACLHGRPVQVSGIGHDLAEPPALPGFLPLVLVNPRQPLATPTVFKARAGAFTTARPLDRPTASVPDLALELKKRRNDLEPPARFLLPAIDEVLAALEDQRGCLLVRMSGSGATCFGLFTDLGWARRAAKVIAESRPDWWVQPTSPA
jgi:4-diphosphocytidyl-2-C-methyl-D-erythritol kinase